MLTFTFYWWGNELINFTLGSLKHLNNKSFHIPKRITKKEAEHFQYTNAHQDAAVY